ncbi:MAG: hypothetical protein PUB19_07380 [Lachnospiraceae bacterium]|nr:hypothetical protein [Lachnospiraceae bacterium]
MQIKCDYCGAFFSDTEEQCPTCGAPNNQLRRTASSVPVTIEELQKFIAEKNIPAEKIRFFIGVDYREPKAFGIYKDEMTGNFVVYKNKADGTRAVRYEGKDEAYAVNEIYQKLRDEINRNNEQHGKTGGGVGGNAPYQQSGTYAGGGNDPERRNNNRKFRLLLVLVIIIMVISLFMCFAKVAGRTSGHGGGVYIHNTNGYEYNYDDSDSSGGDSYDVNDSYDDSWDTDWDAGSSWDSDWGSFDSNWDSDW